MEDIITIDGPTSSGKNSVGFLLAQKLGFKYIDSGMIYRAGCLKMLQENVSIDELDKILDIYKALDIKFENGSGWKMYLDNEDVTDKLHTPEISILVSLVASKLAVREVVKDTQRKLAENGKLVISGRDIGSEIFPNAKFKFFLTASLEERAKRRFKQLKEKDTKITYGAVLKDIMERDKQDSEREASPMRIPKDAYVLDNTNLNIEDTVAEMLKHIQDYA